MRSEAAVRPPKRPPAPPPAFQIGQTAGELGSVVVWVLGELDVWSARELRGRLDDLAARKRPTLLDLSATTFIDCAGLAVVLRAIILSERDGWSFALAEHAPAVAALFDFARDQGAAPSGREA